MAPRRKSSFELIAAQARAGRVRKRQLEEADLLSRPHVKQFVDSMQSEAATFSSRIVSGEPLPRMLDGSKFAWDRDHFLTQARDCATELLDDPRWTDWRQEFADFLERLQPRDGQTSYVDPVAGDTVEWIIAAFTDDDFVLWGPTGFRLVDYFGSKNTDGSYLFTDRDEMGFQGEIAPILDRACEALRASNLDYAR